jgi:TolA-binding protein
VSAVNEFPDDPLCDNALYSIGSAYFDKGNKDKAIEYWKKLEKKSPTSPWRKVASERMSRLKWVNSVSNQ